MYDCIRTVMQLASQSFQPGVETELRSPDAMTFRRQKPF